MMSTPSRLATLTAEIKSEFGHWCGCEIYRFVA